MALSYISIINSKFTIREIAIRAKANLIKQRDNNINKNYKFTNQYISTYNITDIKP